ncbi:BTB/POZ domain-containing protein 8-like [Amphiura filiformis]|uniref:BTB/POZ domain-containing protein 8-like n=1 Tax=Amphiura filiformis TaxID=82378 RepID=UPI003B2218F1
MASKNPKRPVMSTAFKEKATKEKEKLQKILLATQLHTDMLSMCKEGQFSDVTLTCGVDRYAVHLPLIHARLPDLYASFAQISGPQNGMEEHPEFDLGKLGLSPDHAKELIQLLYTSDNVKSHWCDIKTVSTNKSHSHQEGNTDDAHDPEGCQSINSSTNPPVKNDDSTKDVKDEEDSRTESMRWRKTDPKFNDPGLDDCEHLPNGDMNGGLAISNDTDSEKSSIVLFPDVNSLPDAASPLGRDLLGMLVSGCGHDVKIKVEDKKILAHKFMLCSRSNYFAAMLGGSWVESNSAEINLEGASYAAVLATLCFIYGASVDLPEDVSIREVVYLADMYCLEGLKEAAAFHLRKDNCHFFHKPCNVCLAGVPEAIILSYSYRMTELYESAVRWVLKYLDRAWSQRNFAGMPAEVIHQCSEFAVTELSHETAVTMTIQVDKLVQSLPRVKWSVPVHKEAQWLLDACIQYIAIHFLLIVQHQNFEMLLVGLGWNKDLLESLFDRIVHSLSEDTAIPAYLAVNRLRQKASLDDWNQDALELVNRLVEMCHNYMVKNVNYLANTRMESYSEELQKKIKDDAVFVDEDMKALARRPVLSSSQKPRSSSARGASGNATGSSTRSTSRSAAGQRPGSSAGQRSESRQVNSAKSGAKWKP